MEVELHLAYRWFCRLDTAYGTGKFLGWLSRKKGRLPMERGLAMIASVAFAFVVPNATQAQQQGVSSAPPALDEIYVARSVRLSRVPATSFCDKSNTEVNRADNEDQYIFRAVATNQQMAESPTQIQQLLARSTLVSVPQIIPQMFNFTGSLCLRERNSRVSETASYDRTSPKKAFTRATAI
jgi:hypothetical protein